MIINDAVMSADHRRAKPTQETREEARRLKEIWTATPDKPSQAVFGERFNIGSQSAVALFLSGTTPLSKKAAKGFAVGLGCRVEDFSPRLASEIDELAEGQASSKADEFAQVRRVDVQLSAGHGALVVEEFSKSALTFRRSFLSEIGVSPNSAVIMSIKGRSMEPTIRDGAVLLLSTSAKTVINGEIYALRIDGHLFVKRLHRQPNGDLLAISDNPDREAYPDMRIAAYAQDFEIIGRALWMGARL